MNIDKFYTKFYYLFFGIFLIVMGFILVFLNSTFYKNIIVILVHLFLIIGIKNFAIYFYKKNKNKHDFINCIFNLITAMILSIYMDVSFSIIPILVGFYFLLNFTLQLISTIIIIKHKDRGSLLKFILSFIYLIVGIVLIVKPLKNIKSFVIVTGLYFILLGFNYIYDYITFIIPKRYKKRLLRRIRFTLPVLLEMIIPYEVVNYINRCLNDDLENISFEKKNSDEKIDLEIFVHVSSKGFNKMGHVDIWFDNEVISYGNYDDASKRFLKMIGDGIIFTTDRESYIPFVTKKKEKTIFAYGVRLSENQKTRVRKYINKIKSNLEEWKSPYQIDHDKSHCDYASELSKKTKVKFYKFKTGKYKTYFVVGNNCCYLADKIIGKSGIDLLKMNGIITPGTYYEYLNREFSKKNSIVVRKNIYNEKRKGVKDDKKQDYSKRRKCKTN